MCFVMPFWVLFCDLFGNQNSTRIWNLTDKRTGSALSKELCFRIALEKLSWESVLSALSVSICLCMSLSGSLRSRHAPTHGARHEQEQIWAIWGHLVPSGAIWGHLGLSGAIWGHLGHLGLAIWGFLMPSDAIWNHLGHLGASGAIWGHVVPSGAI